jgi:pyridoxine kinase
MCDQAMPDALRTAVEFTVESMRCTLSHENYNWYGVDFETALPKFLKMLGK